MKKYRCSDIRESQSLQVSEIRRCMSNNHKFLVNYRTPDCCNQLHYYSDTPGIIFEKIMEGEEIWEIGMCNINF